MDSTFQHVETILKENNWEQMESLVKQCQEKTLYQVGYLIGTKRLEQYDTYDQFSVSFLDSFSICAYYSENVDEAFDIMTHLLNDRELDESMRKRINSNRHYTIPQVKNNYVQYPAHIVKTLCQPDNNSKRVVTFTITTCKRTPLFMQTINSFLQCCLD
jgi:hypothetical protein